MKLPDLSPLTLLATGTITGILATLIFGPQVAEIPEGWGDIVGSIFGVVGAFYVARLTFNLEHKTKTAATNRPLQSQAKVAIESIGDVNKFLPEFEHEIRKLSKSLFTFFQDHDSKSLQLLRIKAVSNSLSYDDEKLIEEIEEDYEPIVVMAHKAVITRLPQDPLDLIATATDAVRAIQTAHDHLLDHNEIVAIRQLKAELKQFSSSWNKITKALLEIADWNPKLRPPNHAQMLFLLDTYPRNARIQLASKSIVLMEIVKRLEV
ncbi:hypothetical protein HED22_15570 [Thalassospira sp. HF15]|uniref:hypothetical protein n=1 Tax=Thalassospira sp. HF15 TaxID=2722755 RepID=UPI00142FD145|nr:hypothetical protein [Thalassospira sp. HF15]NIY77072.1 hypothetical protein [Thalassospira sp. HF15]